LNVGNIKYDNYHVTKTMWQSSTHRNCDCYFLELWWTGRFITRNIALV